MNLDAELLDILACPACKSPLRADDPASELVCTNAECGLAYAVRDDIPVLLVEEARRPGEGTEEPPPGKASGSESPDAPEASGSSGPSGPADSSETSGRSNGSGETTGESRT